MTPDRLAHLNGLQRTLLLLKQSISVVETLLGLGPEEKDALRGVLQTHHDAVEKQFTEA